MRFRFTPLIAMITLIGLAQLSCVIPSRNQAQEMIDSAGTAEPTFEAMLSATAETDPTQPPTIEITPTPVSQQLVFDDPLDDLINCSTGEAKPDGPTHVDSSKLTFFVDESEFSLQVEFPQTMDLAGEFTSLGSFLGILILDNSDNPLPTDPDLGKVAMGLMRIDAIWTGQSFDSRVFARDESGSMVEADTPVELEILDGYTLKYRMDPQDFPESANAAGFVSSSLGNCDYAGLNFDFSSGRRQDGSPDLDIQEIMDWIENNSNPLNY